MANEVKTDEAAAILIDDKLSEDKDYWLKKLEGDLIVTGLPFDFERSGTISEDKDLIRFDLEREVEERMLRFCKAEEPLVFAVFLAALKICLHKYSGAEDIIVGTAIHKRSSEVASL